MYCNIEASVVPCLEIYLAIEILPTITSLQVELVFVHAITSVKFCREGEAGGKKAKEPLSE
jgi:hypothetical protein